MSERKSMGWHAVIAIFLPLAYGICLVVPSTRPLAEKWLLENQPVEMLTFLLLVWAAWLGISLAVRTRARAEPARVWQFWALFGIAALFVAGEEVAWGQWFVSYESPEFFQKHNRQRMVTLHNLPGIDARSEIIRVMFGLGGLVGVALSRREAWRKISPQMPLLPWFAVIFVLAGFDFVNDLVPIQETFDRVISKLSEFVEMMIGIVVVLYAWMNRRAFT